MPWLMQAEAPEETGTLALAGRATLPVAGEFAEIPGPFSGSP
jgi:hypothetical protein